MAIRAGVQREEEKVSGEMSFWGSVSSSGPPDDPSSCSFEGSSQAVWVSIFFFLVVEIAVLKNFYLF